MAALDVIVIGAGPAGMAAATEAASHGLRVQVLDEQPAPGGQIYRAIESGRPPSDADADVLGADYWAGRKHADAFRAAQLDYTPGATVWTVAKSPLAVGYLKDGKAVLRSTRRLIIATGAYERPVPIPGWTLPGIMTAGGAQVLLKADGSIPKGRVILAGSGPLLMLVAGQLMKAGADIRGYLETTTKQAYLAAATKLPGALLAGGLLAKGLKMHGEISKSGIPVHRGVSGLKAIGTDRFEAIRFNLGGSEQEIAGDVLLLHEGIVPNVQLTRSLDLAHEWVDNQRYWKPTSGPWGETSAEGILIAGDGAGIDGAEAASASGHLVGLQVATQLGALSADERDQAAEPHLAARKRQQRIRPLLDQLYAPPAETMCPSDPQTIVCRCEEVDVAEIRECVRTGSEGPNQLKAFSRCGMGPCQGRMCGLTVAEVMAKELGRSVEEVGYYRIRSPIKPLPLSALAALEADEDVTPA